MKKEKSGGIIAVLVLLGISTVLLGISIISVTQQVEWLKNYDKRVEHDSEWVWEILGKLNYAKYESELDAKNKIVGEAFIEGSFRKLKASDIADRSSTEIKIKNGTANTLTWAGYCVEDMFIWLPKEKVFFYDDIYEILRDKTKKGNK